MAVEAPYGSTHFEAFKRASEQSQPLLALAHLTEILKDMQAQIDELKTEETAEVAEEEAAPAKAKRSPAKKAPAAKAEAAATSDDG